MFKKNIHIESLYTEMPFEERFAAAKADGFYYVEMWGWDDKDLPRVKQLLDANNLKLAVMSDDGPLSMCDPANKKDYIAYIEKALEAAAIVDCKTLVIHSDSLLDSPQFAKPMITSLCSMYCVKSPRWLKRLA